MATKFCTKCGATRVEGTEFCQECGTAFSDAPPGDAVPPASAAAAPPPPPPPTEPTTPATSPTPPLQIPKPSLTWRAHRRPEPTISGALAGAAGLLLSVGLFALGFNDAASSGDGALGAVLCVVGIAVAIVAALKLAEPVHSAATAILAVCIPGLWLFAFGTSSDPDAVVTLVTLFSVVLWLGFFAWGPVRGRNVFVGLALVGVLFFLAYQVGSDATTTRFGDTTVFEDDSFSTSSSLDEQNRDEDVALMLIVSGAICVAAAAALDHRKLHGLATPFLAVAAVTLLIGTTGWAGSQGGSAPAGLVSLLAGGGLAWVGTRRQRRASTWVGAYLVLIGLVFMLADIAEDNVVTFGLLACLVAVGAVLGTIWLAGTNDDRRHLEVDDPAGTLDTTPTGPTA